MLCGVKAGDPVTFTGVALMLAVVALIATLVLPPRHEGYSPGSIAVRIERAQLKMMSRAHVVNRGEE
jgi:hypothetical protein